LLTNAFRPYKYMWFLSGGRLSQGVRRNSETK
jgi:hypothetical protein